MNPRILELQKIIRGVNAEIEQFRIGCSHDQGFYLARFEWGPGHGHPSRFCSSCGGAIEGITDKEAAAFSRKTALSKVTADTVEKSMEEELCPCGRNKEGFFSDPKTNLKGALEDKDRVCAHEGDKRPFCIECAVSIFFTNQNGE